MFMGTGQDEITELLGVKILWEHVEKPTACSRQNHTRVFASYNTLDRCLPTIPMGIFKLDDFAQSLIFPFHLLQCITRSINRYGRTCSRILFNAD